MSVLNWTNKEVSLMQSGFPQEAIFALREQELIINDLKTDIDNLNREKKDIEKKKDDITNKLKKMTKDIELYKTLNSEYYNFIMFFLNVNTSKEVKFLLKMFGSSKSESRKNMEAIKSILEFKGVSK